MDLLLAQVCLELRQANNLVLPQINAQLLAAKDVGQRVKDQNKWPFELEAGLVGELPLQRRTAREAGARILEGRVLNNIGLVYDKLGNKKEAALWYEKAKKVGG